MFRGMGDALRYGGMEWSRSVRFPIPIPKATRPTTLHTTKAYNHQEWICWWNGTACCCFGFCFARRRHTHSCRWCLWFRLCFLSRWWGFHNICIGVGLFDAQVFVWPTFGGIIPRCRDAWEVLTMPEKQQKCAHWMMRWALLGKANITLTKSPFHSKGVSDAPRPIKTRMWFPKVQCRYKYLQ